jgi:ech hydrogenase subunit F
MFDFIPVALKNVFSKPATRKYPYIKRTPFEKQKGHIAIDIDSCIYCGMCGRKCPVGAIKVDRAARSWSIDRFKCIMCGACSECCPKKCLDIAGDYTMAANVKSVDTFVGKPLPEKTVSDKPAPSMQKENVPAPKTVDLSAGAPHA